MIRLVCIGECMVELRGSGRPLRPRLRRRYAQHRDLSRAAWVSVEYATALGDDWWLIPARQSGGAELVLKPAGTAVTYPGAIIPRTALPVTA